MPKGIKKTDTPPRGKGGRKRAVGRVKNPTEFGKMLYAAITRRGMSANQFAAKVGVSSGFLSGCYSGKKLPPLDRIPKWIMHLGLRGDIRKRFIMLAELCHCPKRVQDEVRAHSPMFNLGAGLAAFKRKHKLSSLDVFINKHKLSSLAVFINKDGRGLIADKATIEAFAAGCPSAGVRNLAYAAGEMSNGIDEIGNLDSRKPDFTKRLKAHLDRWKDWEHFAVVD